MKKRVYLLIMLLITFWSCYEQNFDEAVNPVTTSGFETNKIRSGSGNPGGKRLYGIAACC